MQSIDDAVACWQRGHPVEAEQICKAVIAGNPMRVDAYRLLAEMQSASGRITEAVGACRRILDLEPGDAANLRRLAGLLSQTGDLAAAVALLERSLEIEPENPRGLNNLGNLLTGLGRPNDAIPVIERALAVNPSYPLALNNLGVALARVGRNDAAIVRYEQALTLQERFPEALINLANALLAAGRWDEAQRCQARADDLRPPGDAELIGRGERLLEFARPTDALAAFDRVLRGSSPSLAARRGRIRALLELDQPDAALGACDQLLAADPGVRGVRSLRANALLKLQRASDSLAAAAEAIRAEPGDAEAFAALGRASVIAGLAAEGLSAFDQALALQPTMAKAHAGRGLALAAAGRGADALAAYERAAELNPRDASVLLEIGYLMLRLGRAGNAHAAFSMALELQPDHIPALEGATITLFALNRYDEALPKLAALRAAVPNLDYVDGSLLHAQLQCCEWGEYDDRRRAIVEGVRRGERADAPFRFLAHNDSAADQRRCAEIYAADRCSVGVPAIRRAARSGPSRLRVAYLSADFRDHPVAQLLAGVFESHDSSRIETFAFSAGPADSSALRRRLEHGFDHFLDVAAMQDAAIAARMAELSIDIAVDLGGHTTGSRTRVLAFRPAAVQIGFLGYPGTSGADFIDYLIADRQVVPEADRAHYTEQVIYLPDTYLPNDFAGKRDSPPSRLDAVLPETGFVYCCFNTPYKFSPAIFDSWMRILKLVPDAVLWMREAPAVVKANLAKEAERRGTDPRRLIYAPIMPSLADHQARLSCADVFLDTHPYNAHTTASDALGAGVPVITLRGDSFASRVATSLLHAVGLEQLSVDTPEKYERLAVELAGASETLQDLRGHLRRVRTTAALFDTERFCRNLEVAYFEVAARHGRGERPSTLWVRPASGDSAAARG
jgi:protein O-GlcNAc transferase